MNNEHLNQLQKEIEILKERNRRVEINKAWETSFTRKLVVIITTYIVITITLIIIKNDKPFINSIVPCLGFFLSTLTVDKVKKIWKKYLYKNEDNI